ncbi:hypothetical protein RDI58_024760 [Solanum bulbocastanum]|uniref:Uncharacterized protein n=1 Tax=Solanum bulbocastanum TaxID=147425 RepID=A0AAN8T2J5_SOLBU
MCDHLILTEETVMEPWLKDHVDFSCVFLVGGSAGANIVYDVVVRASSIENPLGEECEGLDVPRLNPTAHLRLLSSLICRKVMVFITEKDFLRERKDHVFHLIEPNCEKAGLLLKRLVEFFNEKI